MDSKNIVCSIDRLTVLVKTSLSGETGVFYKLKNVVSERIEKQDNLRFEQSWSGVLEHELASGRGIEFHEYSENAFGVTYRKYDVADEVIFEENIIYCELLVRGAEMDIRFDFNPNSLELRGGGWVWKRITSFLNMHGAKYRLSRFDLAIDIYHQPEISRLECIRPGVTSKTFKGRDGAVETIYWGSSASDVQVRLYDKLKELSEDEYGMIKYPTNSLWRLEFQMRTKKIDENLMSEIETRLDDFTLADVTVLDLDTNLRRLAYFMRNDPELIKFMFDDVDSRTLRRWKAKVREVIKAYDNDVYRNALKKALHEQMQDLKSELDKYVDIYLGF